MHALVLSFFAGKKIWSEISAKNTLKLLMRVSTSAGILVSVHIAYETTNCGDLSRDGVLSYNKFAGSFVMLSESCFCYSQISV